VDDIKVVVVPTWLPTGKDKLMGIYHKVFCEAICSDKNIRANMLYIDRQRLINPIKYLFMKKIVIEQEKGYKIYKYRILDLSKFGIKTSLKQYTKALNKLYLKYLQYEEKPDIFHAHVTIPAGYATCKLGEKYNIPCVVTEHSSYFNRFFNEYKEYGNYVLKNSYFTTVSNYTKEEMLKYTSTCDTIPNLVDTSIFNNKKDSNNAELNLVTVCALRQGKRVDDIIRSMRILIDNNIIEKIHLNIIGEGFFEDYYKNICNELKMNDYVTFLGKKTYPEIALIFSKSDIFVISSELETFCLPGVEALAAGLPVVSTKCKGPTEYLNDRTGKLCNVADPADMANAICHVYKNINSYDEDYLRSIANLFIKDNIVKKTKEIYLKQIKKED